MSDIKVPFNHIANPCSIKEALFQAIEEFSNSVVHSVSARAQKKVEEHQGEENEESESKDTQA